MTRERRTFVSRRTFLSATAAGFGTLALVACGAGGGTAPTAGAASGEAPAEDAASVAAEGEASVAAEASVAPTLTPVVLGTGGQKVQFWHGLGGADGATMVQMLQQYSADHPDIQLSSETYGWDVFYQKLPTAAAAGTPPNLGIMHSWAIQQMADQGIIQDADTLFFSEGLVPKDDFNQALIEAISVDGKTQAVPFDTHGWICWMNTKVIEDAGLKPDELPANGTEFIAWAKKVTVDEAGKHPGEDGFNPDTTKVFATSSSWQRFTLPSTIWQYGGGIFDGSNSLLNDPKTIAAVQYWYDLIYTHHVAPPATPGQAPLDELFKSNGIALMWDGTWFLNFFKDNPDAAEVMRPVPLNSLAPDGTKAARFDSHMMVIPTGVADENLQAGKDLIVWLSDNGETWATSGQVPARASVVEKPAVQKIPSVVVASDQFAEVGRPGQTHPAINEIVTAYEAAFSAALANTTPPEQAMTDAHTQVQAILDRY